MKLFLGILKAFRKNIIQKISNSHMSLKISLIYALGSVGFCILIFIIYNQINEAEELSYKGRMLSQSIETTKSSIDSMINTIHYNSRVILPSVEVQRILKDHEVSIIEAREAINKNNSTWLTSLPFVDSLYVFDFRGNYYGIDKKYYKSSTLKNITEADWYQEVEALQGYFLLQPNGDYFMKKESDGESVSFLRIINDTVTFQPLGVLMININEQAFYECYQGLMKDTNLSFFILDQNNEVVSASKDITPADVSKCLKFKENSGDVRYRNKDTEYIASLKTLEPINWQVAAVVPLNDNRSLSLMSRIYFFILSIFILLIFLFSFSLILSFISRPIEKMANIMRKQTGNIQKMKIKVPKGEMTILRDTYNEMVERNHQLIETIYQEQKFKRKAELNVLHEQIKPHFLYNTINALQYLAVTKQNDILYDSLEAFGGFYKMALSKGKEVIMVKDEIAIINDYMKLQKLRYGDVLTCEMEVADEVLSVRILKLILQPLVENSIYHGILPDKREGHIHIRIWPQERWLMLQVTDNGKGMTPEELVAIQQISLIHNDKSFGLRGTIERIRIHYENDFLYDVKSEYGVSTVITIQVPMM